MSCLPIGVLASGTGSNFEAIVGAIEAGRLDAEIRLVICNRPGARVLDVATAHGIASKVIRHADFTDREQFDQALADALASVGVELVVMAGFDRLVTRALLSRFPARVLNIHPALLPAFKGMNAQQQAAEYGVTIAGATVHIVDEHVDHGPIVAQVAVPIVAGEEAESVRRRVLEQEHRLYTHAIQLFADGRVQLDGRIVKVAGYVSAGPQSLLSPPLER